MILVGGVPMVALLLLLFWIGSNGVKGWLALAGVVAGVFAWLYFAPALLPF